MILLSVLAELFFVLDLPATFTIVASLQYIYIRALTSNLLIVIIIGGM